MTAHIDINLEWSETKPGWISNAYCASFREAAHIRATADIGGYDPIPSIAEAVNSVAQQINCHPENVEILVKLDGVDLSTAYNRSRRL
jgi:hypothetical protein